MDYLCVQYQWDESEFERNKKTVIRFMPKFAGDHKSLPYALDKRVMLNIFNIDGPQKP